MKNELEKNIKDFIKIIGENPERDGLIETPKRVAAAWKELLAGYDCDDKSLYKTFHTDNNDLVIVKDIEFMSFCEHHIMPFSGIIAIGYIPNNKVLGFSKFGRIVDCFSKRLQIQEKLVCEIGKSLLENLNTEHIFVVCKADHSCMSCRGVKKQNSKTMSIFTHGKLKQIDRINVFALSS